MLSQLVIIHASRRADEPQSNEDLSSSWLRWQTCVRDLKIGFENEINHVSGQEIYKGRDAYRFLLEIVCGLQSPVKGETEVHGQYRELLDRVDKNHKLYPLLHKAHLDARKVRTSHLQGLGSQSYGSLARKKLRGFDSVALLGAGQLTREILPWLAKHDLPLNIFVRKPDKHQDLAEKYKSVRVHGLTDQVPLDAKALILAAPMSSAAVTEWLKAKEANLDLILDYRGESHFDPLAVPTDYYSLRDIFREIDNTQQKVEAEIIRARQLVASLCESY